MKASIAKSTAHMTGASVLQKIVAFFYFALVARTLGADDTGKYVLALSFTTIFVVFVDLGFTNVLIREAAKFKEKIQTFVSTIVAVKLVLGALTYVAAVMTVNLLGYDVEIRQLVYLSAVTMLFDSLHLTLYGILRAIGDLKWEAGSIVLSQVATLALGTFFIFGGYPLIFLILAFTIPSVLNATYAAHILWSQYKVSIRPAFNRETFLYIGKIAIPFAIAAIFARLYSYLDSIILSKLLDTTAVGQYSIATKITFAFQFIPLALIAAVYPRFSEYYATNKEKLARMFEQSMKYLLVVAFPIAAGISLLAQDLVVTLFSVEYAASVLPLQILMASLIFSFVSFPIGAILNACDKQVTQTVIVGMVLIINVIANLLLIPNFGITGAALAAFIGNACLSLFGYLIVPKITPISHFFLFKTKLQLITSVSVMAFVVWQINIVMHFSIAIIAGAVIYPIMLFVTGAVTKKHVQDARALLKR